jgi:transcription elongation factor Elf1
MKMYQFSYYAGGKINKERRSYANLLPCPFCGSENLEVCNTHTPSFWIECGDCEASARGDFFPRSFAAAIQSASNVWNRRMTGIKSMTEPTLIGEKEEVMRKCEKEAEKIRARAYDPFEEFGHMDVWNLLLEIDRLREKKK